MEYGAIQLDGIRHRWLLLRTPPPRKKQKSLDLHSFFLRAIGIVTKALIVQKELVFFHTL